MFEDSLVESRGSIRTRSKRYAIASFALEATILAVLILIPYFYPAALPEEALSTLLVAPPPPTAPPQMPHVSAARVAVPVQLSGLEAPRTIPRHIPERDIEFPIPPNMDGLEREGGGNVIGATFLADVASPPISVVPRSKPAGPLRVSSGVAAGHLLVPIQPVYPAIAKTVHIEGVVVIEATISKEGFVERARVVSGQPMLVQAALAAVDKARYEPYKLNGSSVEVETTINIDFRLNN